MAVPPECTHRTQINKLQTAFRKDLKELFGDFWDRGWISAEGNEKEQGQGIEREEIPQCRGKKFLSVGKVFFEVQTAAVSHPQPGSQGLSLKENLDVQGKVRKKGGTRAEVLFVRTKNHHFLFKVT